MRRVDCDGVAMLQYISCSRVTAIWHCGLRYSTAHAAVNASYSILLPVFLARLIAVHKTTAFGGVTRIGSARLGVKQNRLYLRESPFQGEEGLCTNGKVYRIFAGIANITWYLSRNIVGKYCTVAFARRGLSRVEFLMHKTRLMDSLRGVINPRQEKALLRMFEVGIDGFKGGMSAGKYAGLTGAPPATVTRDLADLVAKGALVRVGEKKTTRYHLDIPTMHRE